MLCKALRHQPRRIPEMSRIIIIIAVTVQRSADSHGDDLLLGIRGRRDAGQLLEKAAEIIDVGKSHRVRRLGDIAFAASQYADLPIVHNVAARISCVTS